MEKLGEDVHIGCTKLVINLAIKMVNINFIQILTILANITKFKGDSFKYRKYCAE